MPNKNYIYKGVLAFLFLFVFVYLILRVVYNETLHDEIASYMFFCYYGDYIGNNIVWDANNHLLNSFLGHFLFELFGDNISVLRIPNLLAYVGFFFATYQLTKRFKRLSLRVLSITALNSIPFIIEYFGYLRGYGLSLAFFMWALVYFLKYTNEFSLRHLIFTYLFLLLSVSANLTFVNSSLLIIGMAVIFPFLGSEKRERGRIIREWLVHLLFILCLQPFIYFGLQLKAAGALYYGTLDGLWEVTGKSLSRYVLFVDADWLKYVFAICFSLLIGIAIHILKKNKRVDWSMEAYLVYAGLFFGNIIGTVILAKLFDVNYPEDRTGMYLIILFLLLCFHAFDQYRIGKYLQWSLIFFPISFIVNLSIHTSVFTPDDRMNLAFFERVRDKIQPDESIMIYPIMNWNWPYLESHYDDKKSVALFYDHNTTLTDWLITKTTTFNNPEILKLYDTIDMYLPSTYIAYKRKEKLDRVILKSINAESIEHSGEFFNIAVFSTDSLLGKNIQITTKGHLKTKETKDKLHLIVTVSNNDGSNSRYLYYTFATTYQSKLIDDDYLHHFVMDTIHEEEKEIKVYLWNEDLDWFKLSQIKTDLFELKPAEHELR